MCPHRNKCLPANKWCLVFIRYALLLHTNPFQIVDIFVPTLHRFINSFVSTIRPRNEKLTEPGWIAILSQSSLYVLHWNGHQFLSDTLQTFVDIMRTPASFLFIYSLIKVKGYLRHTLENNSLLALSSHFFESGRIFTVWVTKCWHFHHIPVHFLFRFIVALNNFFSKNWAKR